MADEDGDCSVEEDADEVLFMLEWRERRGNVKREQKVHCCQVFAAKCGKGSSQKKERRVLFRKSAVK